MSAKWVGRAIGIAAMLCAGGASAQASDERAFAVSELLGQGPVEIRGRFIPGSDEWPLQPSFQVATAKGVLTFYAFHDLLLDPVSAERDAMFRTHADHPAPPGPGVTCRTQRVSGDGARSSAALTVLQFRGGHLE